MEDWERNISVRRQRMIKASKTHPPRTLYYLSYTWTLYRCHERHYIGDKMGLKIAAIAAIALLLYVSSKHNIVSSVLTVFNSVFPLSSIACFFIRWQNALVLAWQP